MKAKLFSGLTLSMIVLISIGQFAYAQNNSPYWSLQGNSNATNSSKLGTTNNMGLRIYTNNKLRAYFDPSGNASIGNGTSGTAGYRLYVRGATNGIFGSGSTYGVYGFGNSYGIYGFGGIYGVTGYSPTGYGGLFTSDSSDAVDAYSYGGAYGVYAYCPTNLGVYGYGGSYGTYGSSGYIGTYGYSSGSYGLYGFGNYGLYAETRNNSSYYAGYFVGDVYATTGVYAGSDQKLKQNIREVSSAMNIINQLHPKLYEFRHDGNYKAMKLPTGEHYGLIAQDLEKVLPNLVKNSQFEVRANANEPITKDNIKTLATAKSEVIDFKAVNYQELIPIMIKAMQEQNKVIAQQNDKIDELTKKFSELTAAKQSNTIASINVSDAYLGQSIPNPAKNITSINYSKLPDGAHAQLIVSGANGKIIKQLQLSNKSGTVNIDVSALSAGIYTYSLLINGKLAETKSMQVTK